MKRFLTLFLSLSITSTLTFAAEYNAAERVPVVGKVLLEKNGLPTTTTFNVVESVADNSNTTSTNVISVSNSDLAFAGNDNEVAAVVANELGHIVNGQTSRNKIRSMAKTAVLSKLSSENIISTAANSEYLANKTSLNDNKNADITGVDLMIKAGYNPLAMVVLITKRPTTSTLETLQGKPNNSERAMNTFDYLSYAYPSRVKTGYGCKEYTAFLTYANPIVEERNSSTKKLAKFNKEQAKNQAKRAKDIANYKATGLSGWDTSYQLLQSFTQSK